MAEWIISLDGMPHCILDDHSFRDMQGAVCAWLFGNGVYSLAGEHTGWYEGGVLFDLYNRMIGRSGGEFSAQAGGVAFEMPLFQRRPQVPTLRARRPRMLPAGDDMAAGQLAGAGIDGDAMACHRMRPNTWRGRATM